MNNTIRVLDEAIAKAKAVSALKPPTLAESMLSRAEQVLELRSHGMTRSAIAMLLKPALESDGIHASLKSIRDTMPGPKKKKPRSKKAVSSAASPAAAWSSGSSQSVASPTPASPAPHESSSVFARQVDPMNRDALRNA